MNTSENALRIGYIGVGLMGHGAAKNIVTKGYALTVFDPYAKDNVRDLVGRGAAEGFLHTASGALVFIVALIGLTLLASILRCNQLRDDV